MKGEIDKNFYCSTAGMADCPDKGNCKSCPDYHRKYPTPKQFKEEYGEEYPDDGAVYVLHEGYMGGGWDAVMGYGNAKHLAEVNPNLNFYFVCACTPSGKPDNDWRPE